MSISSWIRQSLLPLSSIEAKVEVRGFRVDTREAAERLERIGAEFIGGFNAALMQPEGDALAQSLNERVDPEFRGFAFEGAAMALTISDGLRLTCGAFNRFAAGPGSAHVYMLFVGAGWAWARLPWLRFNVESAVSRLDPVTGWLALDGYGFHEGYFHWPASVRRRSVPGWIPPGYARRAFDQGLGRSLWFVEGLDPGRVGAAIASFPESRRADLWAGVGLAATYAGGASGNALRSLKEQASRFADDLAQGCAFACEAREHAGNPVAHSSVASNIFCGVDAATAASAARESSRGLAASVHLPAYEVWRQRLRSRFSKTPAVEKFHALGA